MMIRTSLPPPRSCWPHSVTGDVIASLRRVYDFDVSFYEETFLANTLERSRIAANCDTAEGYVQLLSQDGAEAERLLHSLNIKYSAFFRNPLTFALLAQVVLPALIKNRDRTSQTSLRIWSAGCAAGQEALSVVMLLRELALVREQAIPFQIIATDISDEALTTARSGIYDSADLKNLPLKYFRAYFSVMGHRYAIDPALQLSVDFSFYDLLDQHSLSPSASIYGDFDLVLCSNLLFYYRPEIRQRILDKLCRTMRPDAYFVTGEAETDIVAKHSSLAAFSTAAGIFHKTTSGRRSAK